MVTRKRAKIMAILYFLLILFCFGISAIFVHSINPIHGACFYTLIMAHVVLKATSVSLGHSGIHFFGA